MAIYKCSILYGTKKSGQLCASVYNYFEIGDFNEC